MGLFFLLDTSLMGHPGIGIFDACCKLDMFNCLKNTDFSEYITGITGESLSGWLYEDAGRQQSKLWCRHHAIGVIILCNLVRYMSALILYQ